MNWDLEITHKSVIINIYREKFKRRNSMFRDMIEARRRKIAKEEKKKAVKNAALGLGVGSLIGAISGLLFAPQEGKKTREQIADKSKEFAEKTVEVSERVVEKVKENVEDGVEIVKHKFEELKNRECCGGKEEDCECDEVIAKKEKKSKEKK
jgi:gas vesicle protein